MPNATLYLWQNHGSVALSWHVANSNVCAMKWFWTQQHKLVEGLALWHAPLPTHLMPCSKFQCMCHEMPLHESEIQGILTYTHAPLTSCHVSKYIVCEVTNTYAHVIAMTFFALFCTIFLHNASQAPLGLCHSNSQPEPLKDDGMQHWLANMHLIFRYMFWAWEGVAFSPQTESEVSKRRPTKIAFSQDVRSELGRHPSMHKVCKLTKCEYGKKFMWPIRLGPCQQVSNFGNQPHSFKQLPAS